MKTAVTYFSLASPENPAESQAKGGGREGREEKMEKRNGQKEGGRKQKVQKERDREKREIKKKEGKV